VSSSGDGARACGGRTDDDGCEASARAGRSTRTRGDAGTGERGKRASERAMTGRWDDGMV
jgi:hypothetical protein